MNNNAEKRCVHVEWCWCICVGVEVPDFEDVLLFPSIFVWGVLTLGHTLSRPKTYSKEMCKERMWRLGALVKPQSTRLRTGLLQFSATQGSTLAPRVEVYRISGVLRVFLGCFSMVYLRVRMQSFGWVSGCTMLYHWVLLCFLEGRGSPWGWWGVSKSLWLPKHPKALAKPEVFDVWGTGSEGLEDLWIQGIFLKCSEVELLGVCPEASKHSTTFNVFASLFGWWVNKETLTPSFSR